ncbi:MAG: restriction endonuclease [Firmicutes bacterium]|nr:restriction endonuclease [Bacillota bacterium]
MSGVAFERRLAVLFQDRGYYVETTPTTGDYGADLILTNGSERIIVQAKRYSQTVGVKAVQEVYRPSSSTPPSCSEISRTNVWVSAL